MSRDDLLAVAFVDLANALVEDHDVVDLLDRLAGDFRVLTDGIQRLG